MGNRTEKALKTLAEEYGGIENYHKEFEERRREFEKIWNTDPVTKGRVLRSHLYVEHYLNKYLRRVCKVSQKVIDEYSFIEKVRRIKISKDIRFTKIIPHIIKFNSIRNRFAHSFEVNLTEVNQRYFESLPDPYFKTYLSLVNTTIPNREPIDSYEIFARFVAQRLEECTNPRQHLIDGVLSALKDDVLDIYFGRESAEAKG